MNAKATRRGVKKSRGGCSRCKSQHLKCDERRPKCGRCERLGVICPGYSQPLKWSTKHEVVAQATTPATYQTPVETPQDIQEHSFPLSPAIDLLDWSRTPFPSSLPQQVAETQPEIAQNELDPAPFEAFPEPGFDWSQAHLPFDLTDHDLNMQLVRQDSPEARSQPLLRSLGARVQETTSRIQNSIFHEPSELLSYYFKVVPQLYSMFDSSKNPFRSAVSNAFNDSLAVNLAAQGMAAACLVEVHPRFSAIGTQLREQALEAVKHETDQEYNAMLALTMSGPTGNWFRPQDLDITSYRTMRERLDTLAASGAVGEKYTWFREALVQWDMLLAYAADASTLPPSIRLPRAIGLPGRKQTVHPWNGVARETLEILGEIGRLVRSNRTRHLNQTFITQAHIHQMAHDLQRAQDLEHRLLAVQYPAIDEIASTEDENTPLWHVTTLAELQRYAGLLQLYHVFPDLLSARLDVHHLDLDDAQTISALNQQRSQWRTSFALEALRMLETIPFETGIKDFQPFLLVAFASELVCEGVQSTEFQLEIPTTDSNISKEFAEVAMMRKFTIDRLSSLLRTIPPKPIRICLDIVKETWRRIDNGQPQVYWLDVMIENGWETILA
ncbi:Beauvericin cluster-specific repressor BEA4 [Fulvia fulva]|uniref:Beauvericin cluster-specific repressor BEA4 n=1 Tax=Passalora fulva TaxID=5499 RepID=A0A9Q8LBS3_PASFU|nr:Beauvericin cluster-specific repressor BEA4 [Fulvia fulva]KAK4632397.1 Beauvericin cluster-specific repressor BEA4 [Fulvia fulva]UJO13853.1 Beauvericin cluster-specific repressor BEA4 [Fulvia fulva]WPV11680.1 Beauvericin cluster-specific repressor BEA4 [Fulvia fulva]WPV26126.1 Beauvericin cluster-specific repressor BEA4 [Fulvia fulva]